MTCGFRWHRPYGISLSIVVLLLLPLFGCGNKNTGFDVSKDTGYIKQFVQEFGDKLGNYKAWKLCIAKSSSIKDEDRWKFRKFSYAVKGTPEVDGDTATAEIVIFREVIRKAKQKHRTHAETEKVGVFSWTFVQEDGKWKIQTAKLPPLKPQQ